MHPTHSPRPGMDIAPPKLPAPVTGPPPVSDSPAPSPGHIAPPAPAPVPTPPPAPAVQAVVTPAPAPAPSEPMAVKQAPLANLEIEENNTPSKSSPMSGAELAEATKEVKADKHAAAKKKAGPPGPKSPVAFVVITVLFMVVLSGIAVAMYVTSQS